MGVVDDECCRVPACSRTAVGYIQVGSKGRREVYVGRPVGLNQIPVCADHLYTMGGAGRPATTHLIFGTPRAARAS